ncbi:MAG TPA: AtpZ/AtpI family protein [Thermoanaerobaculia bacterium]|nr:AtpZ/AtpI family protein [Thermoanaerobaculia bacterium]
MPTPTQKPSSGNRLLGIGFEFAAAVAVFTLVGYWVDRHFKTAHWGLVIGMVLGLIGGMYNLIRESLAASKDSNGARQR